MKRHLGWTLGATAVMACLACSGVTPGQKADETVNSAKATSKKAWDRVSEQACTGTRAECDAEQAKNRASEARDDSANRAKEAADRGP